MRSRRCIRYLCDHCSRGFWDRKRCLAHEPRCFRNRNRVLLEGDLYPVPKNPTIGDDGDYSWRHWPVESVGDLVDGCYWPKVDSFCPYGGIDELTSAGWEPEECDEPAVYVGGRWYQTSWECWDMLFRFRGGEHSGDEKLLLVEQEPDFDLWWVVLAPVPVTMRDTPDGRMVVSPEVDDDMPF